MIEIASPTRERKGNWIRRGRFLRSKTPIGWIRRVLGMVVLSFFIYGFLGWGTLSRRIASLIPRTQIGPTLLRILAEGFGSGAFLILILILGSTALFGRWYCAFLCPFGTVQQIATPRRMVRGGRFFQSNRLSALARYGIAGFLAVLLVGRILFRLEGVSTVLDLLDPYGLFGRILRDLVFPLIVFLNWLLFQIFCFFDLYVPLLSYKPDLPVFFATLFLGGSWIMVSRNRGRVYCGSLCPIGTVLGLCGRSSIYRIRIEAKDCNRCGICMSVCPTGALVRDPSGELSLDVERCVLCMNCLEACPHGALRYRGMGLSLSGVPMAWILCLSTHLGKGKVRARGVIPAPSTTTAPLPSRREFFSKAARLSVGLIAYVSISALGAAGMYGLVPERFLFRKRALGPSLEPNQPSTPPGSLGIDRFTSLCLSCHLCVSHCPTGVLSPSFFEYGVKGVFQPTMDYHRGFCDYECTRCGEVCPTGAILPLSVEEKKTVQIGRVKFEQERCVVVSKGTICGACAEVCPTYAVGMIPYRNGLDIPSTDNALCVGCGSCEHACPIPQKAIFVEGLVVHGKAEVRKPMYSLPREPVKKEFPF